MLAERIDPDWQWKRYRNVELTRDDGPKLSYATTYFPVSDAPTLHRSLAKAFEDQRFKTTEIKDRDLRRRRRKQFLEHWLTYFGKLTADKAVIADEVKDKFSPQLKGEFPSNDVMGKIQEQFTGNQFDEFEFNKQAGFVWWIVQVFDALRSRDLNPAEVDALDAATIIMIDVPNPAKVASDEDNFFPFQRAILDPQPPRTESYIQRQIPREQDTWSVNYLELLEVLATTIRTKLQDGVKLTFADLEPQKESVTAFTLGEVKLGEATLTGFPFLDVPRGRTGSRLSHEIELDKETPLNLKIETVLQPKDLLSFIWMLCAEELVELPEFEFEPCQNFDECGNVLKRPRVRICQHCNRQVIQRASTYVLYKKSDDDGVDDVGCAKSSSRAHEARPHQRKYCAPSCDAKKRAKSRKST